MKKVLPILLVLCLCFAFFACGKKDDAGTGDSGSKDTTPAATVADANDETDETTAAEPAFSTERRTSSYAAATDATPG